MRYLAQHDPEYLSTGRSSYKGTSLYPVKKFLPTISTTDPEESASPQRHDDHFQYSITPLLADRNSPRPRKYDSACLSLVFAKRKRGRRKKKRKESNHVLCINSYARRRQDSPDYFCPGPELIERE